MFKYIARVGIRTGHQVGISPMVTTSGSSHMSKQIGFKTFHTSSILQATRADPKKQMKKLQKDRRKNKENPRSHPLYMEISKAIKYLKAAEIGEQVSKSTLSLLVTVIPEKGSKPLSGFIKFPNPVSQSKILIFTESPLQLNLAESNYLMGGQDLIDKIQAGEVDVNSFTHSFATTEFASNLKPIQRILGPRNLMCLPRRGNVADIGKLPELIEDNLGSLPFKQLGRHLSFPIGRCDFTEKQLLENIAEASKTIYGSQPPDTKKPNLIGQTCISSTKGPGIVIDFKP